MTPSTNQINIFNFITTGNGNGVINAVAGSGKTTTLIKCLEYIPADQTVLFLAFNKHIVKELKSRVYQPIDIMTTHQYGWKTLTYHYKNVVFDDLKQDKFIEKFKIKSSKTTIKKAIDLSRVYLTEDVEELKLLCNKHDVVITDDELKTALQIIKVSGFDKSTFDFIDMIWQPVANNINSKWYDWVFIDECQDLNRAQQKLILKAVKPGGRFIAVGDPYQSIYGFNGADPDSFAKLCEIPNTIQLPLSTCYRCSKEVVLEAQKICPTIQYDTNSIDGEVSYNKSLNEIKSGNWVLCRNIAPLIKLFFKLRAKGINAVFNDENIINELISIVENYNNILIRLNTLKDEYKRNVLLDKIEIVNQLKSNLLSDKSEDIVNLIKTTFKHNDNAVVLSTIHKSKGLETDTVYILDANLIGNNCTQEWQWRQENNLQYVMITRAKINLYFIKN